MKGQGREKRKKGWGGTVGDRLVPSRRGGRDDVGAGVRRGAGAVAVGGQPDRAEFDLSVTGHAEFLIRSLTKVVSGAFVHRYAKKVIGNSLTSLYVSIRGPRSLMSLVCV